MAEYIEREAAIKCIESQCVDGKMWGNDESEGTLIEAYSAIDDLMEIPSVGVAPVRHGRWVNERSRIKMYYAEYCYDCSECGQPTGYGRYPISSFCPHCGARMDEEE